MNKPNLLHIFLNEVDECSEAECEQCEHQGREVGGNDLANPDCQPDESYCMQLVETSCPAAKRIFNNYMDDYLEALDNE